MNVSQKFTLEDLAKSSYPIIWDTCVFSHPIGEQEKTNLKDRTEFNVKRNAFLQEFKRVLPKSQFYVPDTILEEMNAYYLRLKGVNADNSFLWVRKYVLQLQREMVKGRKLTTGISYDLQEMQRAVDFTNQGYYLALQRQYGSFKNRFEMSEADFDFLLSGLILAKKHGHASLVSNDFGIINARNELVNRDEISDKNFSFLIKRDFFVFEDISVVRSYKP